MTPHQIERLCDKAEAAYHVGESYPGYQKRTLGLKLCWAANEIQLLTDEVASLQHRLDTIKDLAR